MHQDVSRSPTHPPSRTAVLRSNHQRALHLYKEGRYYQALETIRLRPRHRRSLAQHLLVAKCLLLTGQKEEAYQTFKELADTHRQDSPVLEKLIKLTIRDGDPARLGAFLQHALRYADRELVARAALLLINRNLNAIAYAVLEPWLEVRPPVDNIVYLSAVAKYKIGQKQAANSILLGTDCLDVATYENRIWLSVNWADPETAAQLIDKARTEGVSSPFIDILTRFHECQTLDCSMMFRELIDAARNSKLSARNTWRIAMLLKTFSHLDLPYIRQFLNQASAQFPQQYGLSRLSVIVATLSDVLSATGSADAKRLVRNGLRTSPLARQLLPRMLQEAAIRFVSKGSAAAAIKVLTAIPGNLRKPTGTLLLAQLFCSIGKPGKGEAFLLNLLEDSHKQSLVPPNLFSSSTNGKDDHHFIEVIVAAITALNNRNSDTKPITQAVVRSCISSGQIKPAINILTSYRKQQNHDPEITLQLSSLLQRIGDRAAALAVLMDCVHACEANEEVFERAMWLAILAQDRYVVGTINNRLTGGAEKFYYVCLMYRQFYCLINHDLDSARKIVDEVIDIEHDFTHTMLLARMIFQFRRLKEVQISGFLNLAYSRYPENSELNILRSLALIEELYTKRSVETFETSKAECLAILPEPLVIEVLSRLPPSHLNIDECRMIIQWKFDNDAPPGESVALIARLAAVKGGSELSALIQRLPAAQCKEDELIRIWVDWRCQTVDLLAQCCLKKVAWEEFANLSQEAHSLINQTLESVDSRTTEFGLLDLRLYHDWVADLNKRAPSVLLETEPSYDQSVKVAQKIIDARMAKQAWCAIRLGDGEGMYLPYPSNQLLAQSYDQEHIKKIWWGGNNLSIEQNERLVSGLKGAIEVSDLIGVPPLARVLRHKNLSEPTSETRGIHAIINNLAAFDLSKKVLSSCHISSDLNEWNLFTEVLSTPGPISIISCHDLSVVMAEQFGVALKQSIRIPPEHKFAASFGLKAAGEPMFPNVYDSIQASLSVEPGELFLVGAGIVGKLLCCEIKKRGGIAFDIGALADFWVGYQTRAWGKSNTVIDPKSSFLSDYPFADNFQKFAEVSTTPCRSDVMCRINLEPEFGGLFATQSVQPTQQENQDVYQILITGHPRCASQHIAETLTNLRINIGHEMPLRDGMCSWMHAVQDYRLPYGNMSTGGKLVFREIFAYVRDPLDAIPSIMLENTVAPSWMFRRFHIYRSLGIDIAGFETALSRAVASYMYWTQLVEKHNPIDVIRAETAEADVRRIFGSSRRYHLCDKGNKAAPADEARRANNSLQKFGLPKPQPTAEEYGALPSVLTAELMSFCGRFGYNVEHLFDRSGGYKREFPKTTSAEKLSGISALELVQRTGK